MLVFTLSGEVQLMKAFLPSGKECCVRKTVLCWKKCLYKRLVEALRNAVQVCVEEGSFCEMLCIVKRQMRLLFDFSNWKWMPIISECSNDSGIWNQGVVWSMKEYRTWCLVPRICYNVFRKRKCYVIVIFSLQRWGIEENLRSNICILSPEATECKP